MTLSFYKPPDLRMLDPSYKGGVESKEVVLWFSAGKSVQFQCIDVFDNEDECQADAVGRMELISTNSVQTVNVTTAAITVRDDDRKWNLICTSLGSPDSVPLVTLVTKSIY